MTFANLESKSQTIRILAISGSLRQFSSNTALLQAAIALSPKNIQMNTMGQISANTIDQNVHGDRINESLADVGCVRHKP